MNKNIKDRLKERSTWARRGYVTKQGCQCLEMVSPQAVQHAQPFVAALRVRHGKISCPQDLQKKGEKQEGKEELRFIGRG